MSYPLDIQIKVTIKDIPKSLTTQPHLGKTSQMETEPHGIPQGGACAALIPDHHCKV
jgi:hypothetical protein